MPDNNDDGGDDAEVIELDSESSGDDGTNKSDLDLLLDGVRDSIDRLYKVSTKIRNPSSRLGLVSTFCALLSKPTRTTLGRCSSNTKRLEHFRSETLWSPPST